MKRIGIVIAAVAALALSVVATAPAHSGHSQGTSAQRQASSVWGLQSLLNAATPQHAAKGGPGTPVELQFLNVSDWHGQLDPLVVGTSQVGGAAAISAYWQADRALSPNTLTLTAGDAFGATPPISNFFGDVPAVQALNMMGVQVDTLGNHNFDGGIAHLQGLIDLADYDFVSANLKNGKKELPDVAPWKVFEVGGVKVGVVGVTNPEAPTLVFPGSFGTIVPTDPYKAANKAAKESAKKAKDAGAKVVVLIAHMGVTFIDGTGTPFGPLVDLANNVEGFDVIFGDHTDVQYSGVLNGQLVLENRSKGLTYARTKLTVDSKSGDVLARSVEFVSPLVAAVTPDPAIAALIESYRVQLAPILNVQVGSSDVAIPRADACGQSAGRTCESLVGNVTTDSMRATYLTDFAITNSGGLRANLTCPTLDSPSDFCPAFTPPPFPITRGQVLTVLPFGNVVVTLGVNGAELKTMLENGVSSMPSINGRYPQVSGVCFTYDIAVAAGTRVTGAVRQAPDGTCTGAAVDLTAASTYSLATNDFMASGGDGYPFFTPRVVTRDIMDQVLANYITAVGTVSPDIQGRITCTDSNGATLPDCPVTLP